MEFEYVSEKKRKKETIVHQKDKKNIIILANEYY